MGSFRQDEISVWNDSTQWTPTEIEGKILVFNLQSNGQFLIFDNSRRLVFDFRNEMNQDFTIDSCFLSSSDFRVPGSVASVGTYMQQQEKSRVDNVRRWVRSTGTSIANLEVTATNNGVVSVLSKDDDYGDDWLHFRVTFENSIVGEPVSVFVGDVLVLYIAEITA